MKMYEMSFIDLLYYFSLVEKTKKCGGQLSKTYRDDSWRETPQAHDYDYA